jgi:hypothetical protein
VVKKHNFCAIQPKIPQISNFTKKWDSNPLPHGDVADNIAKMFANFFGGKLDFASKNTIFSDFRDFSATVQFLRKKLLLFYVHKNWRFCKNWHFSQKILKNWHFCKNWHLSRKSVFLRKSAFIAKNT